MPKIKAKAKKELDERENKEFASQLDCPNCKAQALFYQLFKTLPHFGETIFSTISCKQCGFKSSDVMPADFHEPKLFEVHVQNAKDLEVKLIKSSSSTIEIPELGIEIEPGPQSDGFYSNLEGLLDRTQEIVEMVLRNNSLPKENRLNAEKLMENIGLARNGKFSFTVKVWDPFGNSALIGKNVKEKKLNEKELKELKLKTGINVIQK